MPKYVANNDPATKEFSRCVDDMLKGKIGLAGAVKSTSLYGEAEWEFTFSGAMRSPTSMISQELVRIRDQLLKNLAVVESMDYSNMVGGYSDITFRILEFANAAFGSRPLHLSGVSAWDITDIPRQRIREETAIEPFVGYRDFELLSKDDIYEPSLVSRNGLMWEAYQPLIATCNGNIFAKHDAPSLDCQCGIYAFNTPTHPDLREGANIWGEVYLWGDVLVCPEGYRAQYAYPKTLFVKDVGTNLVRLFAQNLEKAYGVPVHLVDVRTGKTAGEIMEETLNRLLDLSGADEAGDDEDG